MSETFDVVIATYNRPLGVLRCITQILKCDIEPDTIYIIDSSDDRNDALNEFERVKYIHTHHKNQPFQRYIGSLLCESNIVIFMDDDVHILNNDIFHDLLQLYEKYPEIVGASCGIRMGQAVSSDANEKIISPSILYNFFDKNFFLRKIYKFFNYLLGYPLVASGEISFCGIKGSQASALGYTEWFYGPLMSFKNEIVKKLFPDSLFSLYEARVGKSEDLVISMRASGFGKLIYNPEIYLDHPNEGTSNYMFETRNFYKRMVYSRLFLSLQYCESRNKPIFIAYLHFYWYIWWRFISACLNFVIKPNKKRGLVVRGYVDGILQTFRGYKSFTHTPSINWDNESTSY